MEMLFIQYHQIIKYSGHISVFIQGVPFNFSAAYYSLHSILCCCDFAKSYSTLCNPTDCSTPGLPVLQHLPEFAQTPVH